MSRAPCRALRGHTERTYDILKGWIERRGGAGHCAPVCHMVSHAGRDGGPENRSPGNDARRARCEVPRRTPPRCHRPKVLKTWPYGYRERAPSRPSVSSRARSSGTPACGPVLTGDRARSVARPRGPFSPSRCHRVPIRDMACQRGRRMLQVAGERSRVAGAERETASSSQSAWRFARWVHWRWCGWWCCTLRPPGWVCARHLLCTTGTRHSTVMPVVRRLGSTGTRRRDSST